MLCLGLLRFNMCQDLLWVLIDGVSRTAVTVHVVSGPAVAWVRPQPAMSSICVKICRDLMLCQDLLWIQAVSLPAVSSCCVGTSHLSMLCQYLLRVGVMSGSAVCWCCVRGCELMLCQNYCSVTVTVMMCQELLWVDVESEILGCNSKWCVRSYWELILCQDPAVSWCVGTTVTVNAASGGQE